MYLYVTLASTAYIRVSAFGIAEAHYERFEMFIDNALVMREQASNNNYCQVSTCRMCSVQSQERVLRITPGSHVMSIHATSLDGLFHQNCFFQFQFAAADCTAFSCTSTACWPACW